MIARTDPQFIAAAPRLRELLRMSLDEAFATFGRLDPQLPPRADQDAAALHGAQQLAAARLALAIEHLAPEQVDSAVRAAAIERSKVPLNDEEQVLAAVLAHAVNELWDWLDRTGEAR